MNAGGRSIAAGALSSSRAYAATVQFFDFSFRTASDEMESRMAELELFTRSVADAGPMSSRIKRLRDTGSEMSAHGIRSTGAPRQIGQ